MNIAKIDSQIANSQNTLLFYHLATYVIISQMKYTLFGGGIL